MLAPNPTQCLRWLGANCGVCGEGFGPLQLTRFGTESPPTKSNTLYKSDEKKKQAGFVNARKAPFIREQQTGRNMLRSVYIAGSKLERLWGCASASEPSGNFLCQQECTCLCWQTSCWLFSIFLCAIHMHSRSTSFYGATLREVLDEAASPNWSSRNTTLPALLCHKASAWRATPSSSFPGGNTGACAMWSV